MPPKGWKKKPKTEGPSPRGVEVASAPPKRLYVLNFTARARVEKYVLASSMAEAETMAYDNDEYVVNVRPGYASTVQAERLSQITQVDDKTVEQLKAAKPGQMLAHANMLKGVKHLLRKVT